MTATNHALTGAAIALVVSEPALAVPLAFTSHFLIDVIPHYEPDRFVFRSYIKTVFGDAILAIACIAIIGLLLPYHFWLVFWCAAAAVLPDILWVFDIKALEANDMKAMKLINRWHQFIQTREWPKGKYIEIVLFLALAAFILFRYWMITNAPK